MQSGIGFRIGQGFDVHQWSDDPKPGRAGPRRRPDSPITPRSAGPQQRRRGGPRLHRRPPGGGRSSVTSASSSPTPIAEPGRSRQPRALLARAVARWSGGPLAGPRVNVDCTVVSRLDPRLRRSASEMDPPEPQRGDRRTGHHQGEADRGCRTALGQGASTAWAVALVFRPPSDGRRTTRKGTSA